MGVYFNLRSLLIGEEFNLIVRSTWAQYIEKRCFTTASARIAREEKPTDWWTLKKKYNPKKTNVNTEDIKERNEKIVVNFLKNLKEGR